MDIKELVISSIKNKVKDAEIKESTNLSSLGLDSLDLVEITLEIEDKFHIDFTSNDISHLETVKDVISLIERKTK